LLAFADASKFPPILFLNHADHIFWLGSSIAHVVINLRDAATDMSINRRDVEPMRNYLLPTIVDQTERTRTREEAKAALGIDGDAVLLVSVARAAKYRSVNGRSFADLHVSILQKYPNARFIVVGSGEPSDWKTAKALTGDRITGLAEVADPKIYFEAADIYLDSYPFVSSTSMMEAGAHGSPLVSLFTAPDAARIFGINHVGLVGTALVANSFDQYDNYIGRLISDLAYRDKMGEAARQAVSTIHTPPGWTEYLEGAYALARDLRPLDETKSYPEVNIERPHLGPPDSLHEEIFGFDYSVREIRQVYMGALPLVERLALWREMISTGEITNPNEMARLLLPEWLKRRLHR
jgi:hypothetical protein